MGTAHKCLLKKLHIRAILDDAGVSIKEKTTLPKRGFFRLIID